MAVQFWIKSVSPHDSLDCSHFQSSFFFAPTARCTFIFNARYRLSNQKRFQCYNGKPIRAGSVPGFLRALLSLRHTQKSRALGSRMAWANNLCAKPHDFLSCMRNVRHTHREDASSLPVLHILHAPSNVSSI